jgi:hypothetical protein
MVCGIVTGVDSTNSAKPNWKYNERTAKLAFALPYVGELFLRVETQLPGSGMRQTPDERKDLALRHAPLLLRNLTSSLERSRNEASGDHSS